MQAQFIGASEAAQKIPDGATVALAANGGGQLEPNAVIAAIEQRFLDGGSPNNLRLVHALGVGDRKDRGVNGFAHEGMTTRVIGGHWTWSPKMMALAAEEKIAAYVMPAGAITHLYRESGARRPGYITKTGLGTFADPRNEGCRANNSATEELVELLTLDGEEYLRYRPLQVDVAIIRGTEADEQGNIGADAEPAVLDALEAAQAARGCGGIVIVQVKRKLDEPLDPRRVFIPASLVDYVVVEPNQWQTYEDEEDEHLFDPVPSDAVIDNTIADDIRTIVARRAAREVKAGDVLNLGFGMSADVGKVLRIEDRMKTVRFAVEQGLYDGIPELGDLFGMSRGPSARVSSSIQFDLFAGGLIDISCLGLAQVDARGNVNVSSFGGTVMGPGGFVDISQNARTVVFCGAFRAKGLRVHLEDNKLVIDQEGQVAKFVPEVEQVTYSGPLASEQGRRALYVTERCVFELTPEGLELIEVAPGIDIQADILDLLDFAPIVRDPRQMPPEIFESLPTQPQN